jgi:hypothetical protein
MSIEKPNWFDAYDRMFGDMDSRLKRPVREVYGTPTAFVDSRIWEPVFCSNCGKPGGHVTKDTPILYICQACHEHLGPMPLPVVPGTEDL